MGNVERERSVVEMGLAIQKKFAIRNPQFLAGTSE